MNRIHHREHRVTQSFFIDKQGYSVNVPLSYKFRAFITPNYDRSTL